MLKRLKYASILAASLTAVPTVLQSCDDNSEIGSSIVSDGVVITVDSSFVLTGQSAENNALRSRTITQLIGNIDAPGFGYLSSDVVTQFMPALELDTTGITRNDIDSLKLQMLYQLSDGYTGDSIVPMGIKVYPLTKNLPSPIYSDFNPAGYFDPGNCIGQTIYSTSWDNTTPDEIVNEARRIDITLPVELGRRLFDAYKNDPASFSDPEPFAKNIFKGLYIKSSFGSGRIVRVEKTLMNMFYHRTSKIEGTDRDTTINYVGSYFAVTPEIISNNNIRLNLAPKIRAQVYECSTIIEAPAALDAEVVFPAREIKASYKQGLGNNIGVVNSLTMSIKADPVSNEYDFDTPPHLLLVLKKDREKFFADNQITDNKTSFYAAYDSTTGTYTFSGLRDYINDLIAKDEIKDEDITFVLTPVNIVTEQQSDYYTGYQEIVTAIIPYITKPVMCRIDYAKTKIKFTFSKQTFVSSAR